MTWTPWPSLGRRTIPTRANDTPAALPKRKLRANQRPAPERTCAVTRQTRPRAELIRFVLGPDGAVHPDVTAKLPGRGVWLVPTREIVDLAIAKGAFSRGFKAQVAAPEDLSDRVEAGLLARCTAVLGLARKAGLVVAGFDQVRASLRKAKPAWLIEARDGAGDGRAKVLSLAAASHPGVPVAGALSSAELGMAFGREGVIHALLRPGPMVNSWSLAYGQLKGFRRAPEDHWTTTGGR
ncbi:MAG: RNA-binding protein [Pseudomonadota bacterium]